MTGFEHTSLATLHTLRRNLLRGLDNVAASLADDTFHRCGPKGSAPPAQSGHLTLALLDGVNAELATRTEETVMEND
ncbi:hypothetical protein K1W54_29835 [Micromonospora sp. CPCC 205371]|nr:hypothetical protein [Micromonospora sp. CPCC 205371]